jgi:acyl-homoserine lactone acylase PvdQ
MDRQWLKIGLVFGALAGLAGSGYYFLRKRFLPQTRGNLRIQGLIDPVEVIRDHLGIPHIYARNERDLMFAQGFVHAQDRLWQMDFQRRLVAGRLAEILGEVALPADRWMRILGITGGVPGSKIYKDVFMGQNHPQLGRTFKTKGANYSSHNMIPYQFS